MLIFQVLLLISYFSYCKLFVIRNKWTYGSRILAAGPSSLSSRNTLYIGNAPADYDTQRLGEMLHSHYIWNYDTISMHHYDSKLSNERFWEVCFSDEQRANDALRLLQNSSREDIRRIDFAKKPSFRTVVLSTTKQDNEEELLVAMLGFVAPFKSESSFNHMIKGASISMSFETPEIARLCLCKLADLRVDDEPCRLSTGEVDSVVLVGNLAPDVSSSQLYWFLMNIVGECSMISARCKTGLGKYDCCSQVFVMYSTYPSEYAEVYFTSSSHASRALDILNQEIRVFMGYRLTFRIRTLFEERSKQGIRRDKSPVYNRTEDMTTEYCLHVSNVDSTTTVDEMRELCVDAVGDEAAVGTITQGKKPGTKFFFAFGVTSLVKCQLF